MAGRRGSAVRPTGNLWRDRRAYDVVSPAAGPGVRLVLGPLGSAPAGRCDAPDRCEHQPCRLARTDAYPSIVARPVGRRLGLVPLMLIADVVVGVAVGWALAGLLALLAVLGTGAAVAARRAARRHHVLAVEDFRQPDLVLLAELDEALERQVAASARCLDVVPPVLESAARERMWSAAELLRAADRLRNSAPDPASDAGRAALALVRRARDEVAATAAAVRLDAERLESLALALDTDRASVSRDAVEVDARIAELAAARAPDLITSGSLAEEINRALVALRNGT